MRPNTPTMGAERTAADLRRLRRAPGRGSLCLCLQFEALVRVCVCSIVCFFVSLFVSLVGCLWVYGFSSLFGPLGHLLVCFFCNLGEFFMCVLHLWRPWGSIVAPGAPFWDPWATCCRFSTLLVALGLNFDTAGLHLVTLWRPFWCLFKTLGRDPGPSGDF
jgi:hypothetical protein